MKTNFDEILQVNNLGEWEIVTNPDKIISFMQENKDERHALLYLVSIAEQQKRNKLVNQFRDAINNIFDDYDYASKDSMCEYLIKRLQNFNFNY